MDKMLLVPSALFCLSLHFSSSHPVLDEMRRQFVNPHEVNNLNLADSRIQDVYNLKSSVNNLTKTIGKLENLVNINPLLPRLTKGELLDLMENITNKHGQFEKPREQKPVMIVMPYTTNKGEQVLIEDLFTKPPVTAIIGDLVKNKNNTIKRIIKRKRRPFDKTSPVYETAATSTAAPVVIRKYNRISNRNSDSSQKPVPSTTSQPKLITFESFVEEFTTKGPIQRFPVYNPTTSTEVSVVTKSSQALYNIVKRKRRPTESTTSTQVAEPAQPYPGGPKPQAEFYPEGPKPPGQFYPEGPKPPTQSYHEGPKPPAQSYPEEQKTTQPYAVAPKSPVQPKIEKAKLSDQPYPEGPKPLMTNQVLKLLNAPDLTPSKLESFEPTPKTYLRRRTRPSTTIRPTIEFSTTTQPSTTQAKTYRPYQRYPFPLVSSAKPFELPSATPSSVANSFILPDHLKFTLNELNMDHSLNSIPSSYNSVNYEHAQVPDDVKNILDSFVVYSPTTTSSPDIKQLAENLSPDMKELLMSFGLLQNPDQLNTEQEDKDQFSLEASSTVNRNAYTQFKPLPESAPVMNDMQEFLDRFGLGRQIRSHQRQPKAFSLDKQDTDLDEVPFVELGMLPDSLKSIMDDLGILERNSSALNASNVRTNKAIRTELIEKLLEKPEERKVIKKHIFKPTEVPYAEEELNKLSQLIDIIKQLEKLNKTATEEDFTKDDLKNLTELVGSLNNEQSGSLSYDEDYKNLTDIIENLTDKSKPLNEQGWGPDPLNFDLGLAKNEVKRQENSSSTTEGVEVVTPSVTSTFTTTVESPSNIKQLEESFGGLVDASATEAATLPPPSSTPNTGFYYLLDWNSFLEIDDQKGKRVNLRLQPKVGDPKKFYSVTVP